MRRCTDRISELDNSVLTQILSYQTTKEAARSQALSKRWKNVWVSVPVLDFDFADYWSEDMLDIQEHATFIDSSYECHENFVRIVDDALASRQGQQVDRFRLVWKYQVKNFDHLGHPVRRWILLILEKRPRVLSIYVQPSVCQVNVPDQAFTCPSLEELKLHVDNRYPEVLRPAAVNLPNLKVLNLGYYTIEADCMNKLLLGCPKLAELELFACALNFSEISCGNLKSLIIFGCCHSAEIRVSIPSLQYLQVSVTSYQHVGFVLENMTSLTKACVFFLTAEYMDKEFSHTDSKIMNGLSEVTNLDIVLHGKDAKDMLKHALKNFPSFENLKALHFESFGFALSDCIRQLDRLVRHSPLLEDLTFYRCKDESDEDELLEELTAVVTDHGNCRLSESTQGHTYGSLKELDDLLLKGMKRAEKKRMQEISSEEEEEEEEDVEEGEAEWDDGEEEAEDDEGEAGWEEEEEGDENATDLEEEEDDFGDV
ncbi:F-box family protein [Rhynchospora pubera]|uniref:F-box family protein n=1 Tax=Rhynchospora pubera TaxID=906938 RepID=A0AAV8AKK8_9POAL|nr:F-box family protein [Rhynchospora pubera]KAJ4776987.1 F-box family protein [Rhynchospora pubera]